jgi:Family of unknown function (DUF6011)
MTAQTQGFQPVAALMHRIADSGNAFPKVRLAFGDSPLVLTVAGTRAKVPGAINLTDGKRYGEGAYFGRITPAGEFEPGRDARNLTQAAKRDLWTLLTRMRDGEAESVFAEYGKRFGSCCMCGRDLTNAESVALGIGPICRNRAFS